MGFLQFTHRAFLFHLSPKFPSFPSSASPSRGEQHTSILTGGSAHPDILWRQEGAINSGMRPLAGVLQVLLERGRMWDQKQHLLQSHRVTEPRHRPWGQVALPSPTFTLLFFPSLGTFLFPYFPPIIFPFLLLTQPPFSSCFATFFSLSHK